MEICGLSWLFAIVLLAPAPASPPSPKEAARAAMATQLAPPRAAPRRGERSWLPSSFSLTQDAGFTPWSTFLSLVDQGRASLALAGTSLGRGLRCDSLRDGGCVPLSDAVLAFVWQPTRAPIGLFAGPSLSSVAKAGEMRVAPGLSAGLTFSPASLSSVIRRLRASSKD